MTSQTNALILIAAAIFWNNSSVLASARGDAAGIGGVGLCIAALLLLVVLWNALGANARQNVVKGARWIGSRIKSFWTKNPATPAGEPGTPKSK